MTRPSRVTRPSRASHLTRLPYMGMPDQLSISLPGISRLPGVQPSLSGVRPPPEFTGTPMGSGEFSGSGQTPAIRQAPPLHWRTPFLANDGYATRWCGRRVQLEWTQPCGGAVRLHQSHGYGHGPRPWQSMERQLHWHHSHCQARYGSNEQLRV